MTRAAKRSPEIGDLYHRPRQFSRSDMAWRRRLVRRVRAEKHLFPGVDPTASEEEIRARIDDGVSFLREVSRCLAVLYGIPDLGNKTDPVDELVYIILSRKTRERAYQEAWGKLKSTFPTWDELLASPVDGVRKLVESSGLGAKKTVTLIAALSRLRDEFGSCTLEPARAWPDERLATFLCSLPEIQRKSAFCVMMYAMGRQVFPVDTHVGRVLARPGPWRELGFTLGGLDHKKLQFVLDDLIPPDLRHPLHVNLVVHGRAVCRALRPRCEECAIRKFCATWRGSVASSSASPGAPTFIDLFAGAGGLSEGFRVKNARSPQYKPCSPLPKFKGSGYCTGFKG